MSAQVERPSHPLREMVTYELTGYRRNLEHAIKRLPEHDATRAVLQQRLADVLAEEADRRAIARANGA